MHRIRTRFTHDIVAEVMIPTRPSKKVLILCDGLPTVPSKKMVMEFWAKKGYVVIHPRYRGTWESSGRLFEHSPEKDILDILDELNEHKKIINVWDKKEYSIEPKVFHIFGTSFGGTVALLLSRDPRVAKAVAISPVVDWRVDSKQESLDWMERAIREAFGEGYRYTHADWQKLQTGVFFNPAAHRDYGGAKLFIIHAKDDQIIPLKTVNQFIKRHQPHHWLLARGGHLSLSYTTKPQWCKKIKKFLNSR